jgi:predicted DNA-binding antitoxin AbrB/MazE fold protein
MAITVEAVYENGILKPSQPLPLKEHEKVRVTIEPVDNWVQATAGMLGWQDSLTPAGAFPSTMARQSANRF